MLPFVKSILKPPREIVRASTLSLSDGYDANPGQTGDLYDFALKERGDEERPVAPTPKRKGKRDRQEWGEVQQSFRLGVALNAFQ
ncbi:hypothetical protein [Methylobacterium sp. Leaf85]|uniref:hypothetical protein n=1 Tax=Methylobacterium sp. Leaf85 TaxID=1736241 RepID=UPI0012E82E83|nr:hypothetical protein [Methylobacterium sp. Leaf85]